MAKIKFGAIVTDGSGKLGGHVIGKNRDTHILKNKSVSNKNPTTKQSLMRNRTRFLMAQWSLLTDEQRRQWYIQLDGYRYTDVFNGLTKYNGFTLFQKLNQGRLLCGQLLLSTPNAVHKPTLPTLLNISANTDEILIQSDNYNSNDFVIIYATAQVSQGLSNPSKLLKQIAIIPGPQLSSGVDVLNQYVSVFGTITPDTQLFFSNKTVSLISGFSNGVRAPHQKITASDGAVNLISNGDFSNGTTFWYSPRNRSSLSVASGYGVSECTVAGAFGMGHDVIVLEIGKTYSVSFDYDTTDTSFNLRCGVWSSSNLHFNQILLTTITKDSTGTFNGSFVATYTNAYFGFIRNGIETIGENFKIANVVLKEV